MKFRWLFLLLVLISEIQAAQEVCKTSCPCRTYWWGSIDYLYLWRRERFYPPLVTTIPFGVPVLSDPATRILFGNKFYGGSPQSGGKIDLGVWTTPCLGFGVGALGLSDQRIRFAIDGDANGSPIFARPFFDTSLGADAVSTISGIFFTFGHLDIETNNYFWGVEAYGRYRFLCSCRCKLDLIGGFHFNRLTDNLEINTRTTVNIDIVPILERVSVTDRFFCDNDFYSALLGVYYEWCCKNFTFSLTGKVAWGDMVRRVRISGQTTNVDLIAGTTTVLNGGLLAQPSNSGHHIQHKFEVIPIVDANLQYRICRSIWIRGGYFFMYWPSVALAGEQVDLNINPTQVEGPLVGTPSPFFEEQDRFFWVHGFTAGLCFSY